MWHEEIVAVRKESGRPPTIETSKHISGSTMGLTVVLYVMTLMY